MITRSYQSRPAPDWSAGPTRKLHAQAARVVSVEETERRLHEIARRVPITRVSDLTPLDPLGVPVYVAVTPLARDLTTHAGKGRDHASARVSAMMEAVERVSAERPPPDTSVEASAQELESRPAPRAIDPRRFDLPDDTAYDPTHRYHWIRSRELRTGRDVLMAEDLVCSPPSAGILREVDTNGLASGNTLLEAAVHGLCEVVERDLVSQLEFATAFADPGELRLRVRTVRPSSLPESARGWLERCRAEGLPLVVQHIDSDLGVPTFRALLIDPAYPAGDLTSAAYFLGFGSHPCAALAVTRALSEAFQSRVGFIHGGRDSFNTFDHGTRARTLQARCATATAQPDTDFLELATADHSDLREDLQFLIDRLANAGFGEVIATNLTRPDLGIPVVRVRVPGLACFVVNRRRVGIRCLRHLVPA